MIQPAIGGVLYPFQAQSPLEVHSVRPQQADFGMNEAVRNQTKAHAGCDHRKCAAVAVGASDDARLNFPLVKNPRGGLQLFAMDPYNERLAAQCLRRYAAARIGARGDRERLPVGRQFVLPVAPLRCRQMGPDNIVATVREPLPQLGKRCIFRLPCPCRIETLEASERCGNEFGRRIATLAFRPSDGRNIAPLKREGAGKAGCPPHP